MVNRIILTGGWLATEPQLQTVTVKDRQMSSVWFRLKIPRSSSRGKYKFFSVKALGKQAEFIAKYFKKGMAIDLEGSLDSYEFQDKNGGKAERVEVLVLRSDFGERKQSEAEPAVPTGMELPQNFSPAAAQTAEFSDAGDFIWEEVG